MLSTTLPPRSSPARTPPLVNLSAGEELGGVGLTCTLPARRRSRARGCIPVCRWLQQERGGERKSLSASSRMSFPPFVRTGLCEPTTEALKVSHIPEIPDTNPRRTSTAFPSGQAAFFSTCFAARRQVGPALHALSVPELVAHVMAEVVVAGAAHFVALCAVVVLVTAHPDGVLQPGGALGRHRLLLLAGVDHPFVDAASDQQLFIWTERKAPIKKDDLQQ